MSQRPVITPRSTPRRGEGFLEIIVTVGLLAYVGYYLFSIQGLRAQARMFPTAVLVACAVLLVFTLMSAAWKRIRRAGKTKDSSPPEDNAEREELGWIGQSFLVPLALIGGAFAIDAFGFYIALPALVAALFWIAGCRPWWLPLVLALPVSGVVWLVFDELIGITLPR